MPYPDYTKEDIAEFRKRNLMLTWGMAPWDCIKLMKKDHEEANRKEEAKEERIESNEPDKKVEEKASKSDILEYVATVKVSATNRFVASEHIQAANIGYVGDNFKRLFLNKIEEDVPAAELVISKLKKTSLNDPIMTELGEKKKVFLAHFIELLEKQSKGQSDPLIVNGYANIVYIQDEKGNFWAVGARWHVDCLGWIINASSVATPWGWDAGSQVLSQVS